MTLEAQCTRRLQQVRGILSSVNVMTAIATDAMRIHRALDEVVSLHSILVARSIGEMCECLLPKFVFFQLPVILQIHPHLKSYRPVIILSAHRIIERLTLRVTLNAHIGSLDRVEPGRVDDIRLRRPAHVSGAGAMAFLTANIPFGHGLGFDVVVDRVATVTKRAGWALHVVCGIKRNPPV